jgi:hypothetical protein
LSKFTIEGLDGYIEQKVAEAVDAALAKPSDEDPWYSSRAAAEYMGVSVQRLHDLVHEGRLPRHGESEEEISLRPIPISDSRRCSSGAASSIRTLRRGRLRAIGNTLSRS